MFSSESIPLAPFLRRTQDGLFTKGFVSNVILRSEATKNPDPNWLKRILRYAQNDSEMITFDTRLLPKEGGIVTYGILLVGDIFNKG